MKTLQPGTKVRVLDNEAFHAMKDPHGDMDKYIGKILTIKGRFNSGSHYYTEEVSRWAFRHDSIEVYHDEKLFIMEDE